MKELRIEGRKMTDKQRAHRHLENRLELDGTYEYEGTLDGLWDALMSIRKDCVISIEDSDAIVDNLGQYGEEILDEFRDAEKGNPHIVLDIDS